MNLQQVRYFLAVCRERNFTRAAERCEVRQPSLTAGIQRLEREIGGNLFVRSTPVQLSALGRDLRPLFVRIDRAAGHAHRLAAQYARSARRAPGALLSAQAEHRA
jgi:LysR family hydrogen peroxide-inducible transcriptional activator